MDYLEASELASPLMIDIIPVDRPTVAILRWPTMSNHDI